MFEKTLNTDQGKIHYWVSNPTSNDKRSSLPWLVFLPGLTADHNLFEKQFEYFEGKINFLTWDPPSHASSRPFNLNWSLDDLANYLQEILDVESIERPLLIGQSMGGYTSQAFIDLFPSKTAGFISIDSCPLQRSYYTNLELWSLKHTLLMYLSIPWKLLIYWGAKGTAKTPYGQNLMARMMNQYKKREYCVLAAHGMRILAEAIQKERSYKIDCPTLLICGEHDVAGSAKRYNRNWTKKTGFPFHLITNAGHNSNSDAHEEINALILDFAKSLS